VNFRTECYFVLTIIKEKTISWTSMNKETRQHHISNNHKSISHCSAWYPSIVQFGSTRPGVLND
jgi:hypothetical protein